MSSSFVRSTMRAWAGQVATATGIPFYDTVNINVDPKDAVWFTLVFVSESHEGTFCKPNFIEHGFVSVVFVARAGIGDTAAIAAVEQVVPALFAMSDPALSLINYEPVDEDSFGSADKDYRVSVSMNYRLGL